MRSLILLLTLETFFLILSGQFHNRFLMIAGTVCCVAVTALCRHMRTDDDEGMPAKYWLRTFLYSPWLMWQIFLANIDVAKRVWSPQLRISPKLIKVPHKLKSGYCIATYANSITLTPGTVTVTAGDDEFLVHALTDEAAADLLTNEMHDRVMRIEGGRGLSSFILGVCVMLLVGAGLVLIRALKGPTVFDRILAINAIGTKTVVLVALLGFFGDPSLYLDTSLAYALINFLATIAILRYIKHRRLG